MLKLLNYLSIIMLCKMSFVCASEQPTAKNLSFRMGSNENEVSEFIINVPALFSNCKDGSSKTEVFKEFIPKNESFDNWSEIITVTESLEINHSLENFLEGLNLSYLTSHPKELVVYSSSIIKKSPQGVALHLVEIPSMIIKSGKTIGKNGNKKEFVGTKAIHGDFSIIVLQYSIRFDSDKTTLDQQRTLREKILDFLCSCDVRTRQL